MLTLSDFDGRGGKSLNLQGFSNFQKPIDIRELKNAVAENRVVAISPEAVSKMSEDLQKAMKDNSEADELFGNIVAEIRQYSAVLVEEKGEVREYLVKAITNNRDNLLEKAIDTYDLSGGLSDTSGKAIKIIKTGAELKAALGTAIEKMQSENTLLMGKMAECVENIGTSPDESSDLPGFKRYSWEFCRNFRQSSRVNAEESGNDYCYMFNDYLSTVRRNSLSTKLCLAYIQSLPDDKQFVVGPTLYTAIF